MSATDVRGAVIAALEEVLDPCSCFTDEPVDIVELGLVEDVTVENGAVRVDILPTSPGCSYMPYIEGDIEERIGDLPFVDEVTVDQVTDRIWTRERAASETLDDRLSAMRSRLEAEGVEPFYS